MSSRSRSAVRITARCIVLAMNKFGGYWPGLILSKWPASFGNKPAQRRDGLSRIRPRPQQPLPIERQNLQHRPRAPNLQYSDARCSLSLGNVASCFTPRAGPHMPISRSTSTGRPGPFAASGFAAGCGAPITRPPVKRRAQGRSAQPSICWRRERNSMVESESSTSAMPSTPAASISISPTSRGARSKLMLTGGELLGRRRFASAGPPVCCRCPCHSRVAQSERSNRSSICQTRTILS